MSIALLVTTLIVVVSPGPGVLYTVAAGLSRGGRASVVAGVLYLLYLAWSTLRERGGLSVDDVVAPRPASRVIVSGILANTLNPKLSILFFAFLPQFVSPRDPHSVLHMLGLSAVFMVVTFVVFVGYGLSSAVMTSLLQGEFRRVGPRPRHVPPAGADLAAPHLRRRVCRPRRQAGGGRALVGTRPPGIEPWQHDPVQYVAFGPHLVQAAAVVGGACAVALTAAYPSVARRDLTGAVRVATRVLLVAAVICVLDVTLRGTTSVEGSLNLIPGAGVAEALDMSSADSARNGIENLIGNVVLFVPVGFLAVVALRKRVPVVTVLAAALSAAIECTQLLLGDRYSDIDDVLLNSTGAFVGALVASRLVAAVVARRRRYVRAHP